MGKAISKSELTTQEAAEPSAPARFREIGGTGSEAFNQQIRSQAIEVTWFNGVKPDADRDRYLARVAGTEAAMAAIGPQDAMEAMLAMQMVGVHNATAECLRRAMLDGRASAGRDADLNQANKLSRTFATLAERLDKHRGGGKQTVRVEHVHVHAGAQAVVGSVTHNTAPAPAEADPSADIIDAIAARAGGGDDAENGE